MVELARQHNEELRVYRQITATDLALKSQLLEVFEDTYFYGLSDRHTGFTGVTYVQMITHLYTNYGIITAIDIIENEKRMDARYDPSVAIESYFEQIGCSGVCGGRKFSFHHKPNDYKSIYSNVCDWSVQG